MRRMVRATAAAAPGSSSRILSTTVCATRTSESSSVEVVSAASVLTVPRLCWLAAGVDGGGSFQEAAQGFACWPCGRGPGLGGFAGGFAGLRPDVNRQLKLARCLPGALAGLDGLVRSLAGLPGKAGERDAARVGQKQQEHDHKNGQPGSGAMRGSQYGPGADDDPQRAEVADEPKRRVVAELAPGVGVEFLDSAPGGNQLAGICVVTGIAAAVGCHDEFPR